eukprot:CAMPEP_0172566786 /NCGR_PEP_ID=MMETSP1067-20121228/113253_1 /TAXON_ID=265564 ORGANISM="Thalassiosira punctigera, Strain Tpunct2005C2" /NCGR_SAMPLE_ID=MMETSP1067 /ASSEMBLY_ACC=CAM_ASM_000444 /LENGTH=114 /DNA_ID=CAMNT_0013357983 /DNA_START=217 /DNA_END=561 /DNA_ORIENTATION=-
MKSPSSPFLNANLSLRTGDTGYFEKCARRPLLQQGDDDRRRMHPRKFQQSKGERGLGGTECVNPDSLLCLSTGIIHAREGRCDGLIAPGVLNPRDPDEGVLRRTTQDNAGSFRI